MKYDYKEMNRIYYFVVRFQDVYEIRKILMYKTLPSYNKLMNMNSKRAFRRFCFFEDLLEQLQNCYFNQLEGS